MPETRRRAQNFWAALFVAALHAAVFSLLPARIKISMPERASEFEYVFIQPPDLKISNRSQVHASTFPPSAIEHRKSSRGAGDSLSLIAPPQEARDDTPIVDWNAELDRFAKDNSGSQAAAARRDFGFPHHSVAGAANAAVFQWDRARTQRVESLPEGGLLVNLNDRCVLLLAPLPFPVCRIGTKFPNGKLFEHMHDAMAAPDLEALP